MARVFTSIRLGLVVVRSLRRQLIPSLPFEMRRRSQGSAAAPTRLSVVTTIPPIRRATSAKYNTSSGLNARPSTPRSRYDNHFLST